MSDDIKNHQFFHDNYNNKSYATQKEARLAMYKANRKIKKFNARFFTTYKSFDGSYRFALEYPIRPPVKWYRKKVYENGEMLFSISSTEPIKKSNRELLEEHHAFERFLNWRAQLGDLKDGHASFAFRDGEVFKL